MTKYPGRLSMTSLNGMKDIAAYVDRSEVTVKKWIERQDLPAGKIGGSWISETEMIDQWRARRVAEGCQKANAGRW